MKKMHQRKCHDCGNVAVMVGRLAWRNRNEELATPCSKASAAAS
jgi:hypothetical protein